MKKRTKTLRSDAAAESKKSKGWSNSDSKRDHIIYTIGHSTRPIEEFIKILNTFGIEQVVDIRTVPRSRHNPQYNKENLPKSLNETSPKIKYLHMAKLGGLRHAHPDSINKGWRNSSFRGYADYMQSEEFESALDELIQLSKKKRIVLMCAESVPWRCHRSLISDMLLVRGFQPTHIFNSTTAKEHKLIPWALVRGKRITYPLREIALPPT